MPKYGAVMLALLPIALVALVAADDSDAEDWYWNIGRSCPMWDCGTKGKCCMMGVESRENDCDGTFGGAGSFVCSKPPTSVPWFITNTIRYGVVRNTIEYGTCDFIHKHKAITTEDECIQAASAIGAKFSYHPYSSNFQDKPTGCYDTGHDTWDILPGTTIRTLKDILPGEVEFNINYKDNSTTYDNSDYDNYLCKNDRYAGFRREVGNSSCWNIHQDAQPYRFLEEAISQCRANPNCVAVSNPSCSDKAHGPGYFECLLEGNSIEEESELDEPNCMYKKVPCEGDNECETNEICSKDGLCYVDHCQDTEDYCAYVTPEMCGGSGVKLQCPKSCGVCDDRKRSDANGFTQCFGWRQTHNCDSTGPRHLTADKSCTTHIQTAWSGYCECEHGRKAMEKGCETFSSLTLDEIEEGLKTDRCENACLDISGCSYGGDDCCQDDNKCGVNEGDCDDDDDCVGPLKCGENNCPWVPMRGWAYDAGDDCCYDPEFTSGCVGGDDCCTKDNRCFVDEGDCDDDNDCQYGLWCKSNSCSNKEGFDWSSGFWGEDDCCQKNACGGDWECENDHFMYDGKTFMANPHKITTKQSQALQSTVKFQCVRPSVVCDDKKDCIDGSDEIQCMKDNTNKPRYSDNYLCNWGWDECCHPNHLCGANEGDCDADEDCKGDLKCGTNNCEWNNFRHYYRYKFDKWDDCCYDPTVTSGCRGGDDCCTPENPCFEDEGDCDEDADCVKDLICSQRYSCSNVMGWDWDTGDFRDDCCVKPTTN